ncbi:copper chaperone PCu(A)C [Thermus thermamylovorans]|uniref:Copper chaperone PCu(A)C n=2 Tax=Thermus thermamylovorans TaxID=2509362 RepID=A0A4Q9B2T2_9DEIN|nr:copper chaperone PCu(A)C [Thermus thermamylovorans]TBH17589.1 copper chaperone PCu(A)C [Thermus thermamylovorans]
MRPLFFPLLALLAMAAAQPVATGGWVRLVPPVVRDTAAYLTLENRGRAPLRLVGGETPVAERVSIHQEHREHRGGHVVLGMRPLPHLDIPPGGRVEFRPGRYHLMLEGLRRPLQAGERVEIVLKFQDGTRLRVVLPVEMR